MKTLALSARLLSRDWKSGELTVLAVALVVAVTAMTAVSFLTDRGGQVVQLRAAESLAADLHEFELNSSAALSGPAVDGGHVGALALAAGRGMLRGVGERNQLFSGKVDCHREAP